MFRKRYGYTYGVIKNILPREVGGLPILVEWNNGEINSYSKKDLAPMQKEDYDFIERYKKVSDANLLRAGDRVVLEKGQHNDASCTPIWGGKHG